MSLERFAWLLTTIVCLLASLCVLLGGYQGYAGVLLALAIAAAINLK